MKRFVYFLWVMMIASAFADPIPAQFRKTAGFIFRDAPKGLQAWGTCFAVGVPLGTNGYKVGLVTARHVMFGNMVSTNVLSNLWLRVNVGTNGVRLTALTVNETNALIITPADRSIDLALVFPNVRVNDDEFPFMPLNLLMTREEFKERNVREGDDVFFVGLFAPFVGTQRNYPISRFGRVAMLPDERVPMMKDVPMAEVLLLDLQSYGGNSGSPAFISFGNGREAGVMRFGGPEIRCIGLISAGFRDEAEIFMLARATNAVALPQNGVAAIVPSYQIRELIEKATEFLSRPQP